MAYVEGTYTQPFVSFLNAMPYLTSKRRNYDDTDEELGLLQGRRKLHSKHHRWHPRLHLHPFARHPKSDSKRGYNKLRHSCPGRITDVNSVHFKPEHESILELQPIRAGNELSLTAAEASIASRTLFIRTDSAKTDISCEPYSKLMYKSRQRESNNHTDSDQNQSLSHARPAPNVQNYGSCTDNGVPSNVTFTKVGKKLGKINNCKLPANPQMYGRYRQELSQFAKTEAARQKEEQKRQKQLDDEFRQYRGTCCYTVKSNLIWFRDFVFSKIGEDWIFLALLGIIMALLSFAMDYAIAKFQTAQVQLFTVLKGSPFVQYFAWTGFPIIFIIFSTGFVHLVSPNAIGSGIPEMKTILRGVVLKEYLSFRTLISKVIGVATSLGSGLPIGKEGPFVHIASIVSTILSKLIVTFKGIFENESRNSEMLAAACAVGVSCNFAAPIGGVLFSIEVTSTYFAVRNYWRGFFGAVCGAFVFRLLAVWNKDEETITALFKTTFRVDFPFDPQELIAFAFIGIVCGFGGALFVFVHRRIVDFNRTHKRVSAFLMKNRFLYPFLVSLVISSITFPLGLGQFMAGELTQKQQIDELFSNTTLGNDPSATIDEENKYKPWHRPNVFVTLGVFIVMQFWMTALAVTLPVPAGVFIPVFTLGAAFGRLVGECMAAWFPQGIHTSDAVINKVIPGGYAVVGAAALSGSVTHTISTSVIVFELTGQITHILPVMMAVLIANAIAQLLQPSFYDSIIQIKKLPYLPDISHAGSKTYEIFVEDIMVRYVKFISWLSTYADLKELLDTSPKLQSFPLVDAPESMILLGSVQRSELEYMLEKKVGLARRLVVVADRKRSQGQSQPGPSDRFSVVSFNAKSDENNSQQISIRDASDKDATGISLSNLEGMLKRFGSRDSILSSSTDSLAGSKKKPRVYKLPIGEFEDMSTEEHEEWESEELKVQLDFSEVHIDPAPFQLVERTSLHKCHSMFSLLGLNHTYVTTLGRLVGVVSLKEIRRAIERSAESNNRSSFQRSHRNEPQNIIQAEGSSS